MAKRPTLPEPVKLKVLYLSGFCCAVCQNKADHIHHINKVNSDNRVENLVALCAQHHDEAHTKRELSQNLTPDRLLKLRSHWYADLTERRALAASVTLQRRKYGDSSFGSFASWGYINHRRVIELSGSRWRNRVDSKLAKRCLNKGLLDSRGILVRPHDYSPPDSYVRNTVYDWFDFGDDQAVHLLYTELVDALAEKFNPLHLDDLCWTKRFIKNHVKSGQFVFARRATYFRRTMLNNETAQISARTFAKRISIEYGMNTEDMFGTTSITCSFSGHKTCSAFLLVKSINSTDGWLKISCTPVAVGVCFRTD